MAVDTETKFCVRCKKVMKIGDFYKSNNTVKYPDEHVDLCKSCFVAHLDNWDPETYIPLLEEVDVPYVPDEWNGLLARQAGNPEKMTPTTIFGKYLAKMKLNQFRKQRFADSENLQKIKEKEIREALEKQGKSESEIQEVIAAGTVEAPPKPADTGNGKKDYIPDPDIDLTEEDVTYLSLKWGRNYQPFEWVQMEQLYNDFVQSYDIQTAGHIDTLKAICKTSLRMNQLFDLGDIDGALKMTKAYDQLMKSGKFTAAQNKAESGEFVDSVGEIAMMCEKHEFIPMFYSEEPLDKVDWVIKDNQNYVRKLITEEMNLADMLDKALKNIEEDKKREEDDIADEDGFEEDLFADTDREVTDEDIIQFKEFEEELEKEDKKRISDDYTLQEKKRKMREDLEKEKAKKESAAEAGPKTPVPLKKKKKKVVNL